MQYVTANRIRLIDKLAQEKFSIPSLILMENAGIAAKEEIMKYFSGKSLPLKRVAVFSGKGNNGGDGFVVARQLKSENIHVDVFLVGKAGEIKKSDPQANFKPLKRMGIKIAELTEIKNVKRLARRFQYNACVDAIFGTGFSGDLPVHVSHLINFINKLEIPVFSIDVPSGLDATTGRVYDTCVKADVTISFGLPKTGFIKGDGPGYAGSVVNRNISYPIELLR